MLIRIRNGIINTLIVVALISFIVGGSWGMTKLIRDYRHTHPPQQPDVVTTVVTTTYNKC